MNLNTPDKDEINNLLRFYQNGHYVEAEKLALSIKERFPKHQFSWKVLGAIYKKTGRINESLILMKKSVELEPKDSESHNNLGIILQALGKFQEAEISYKKTIILKPDDAETYCRLGNVLMIQGKLKEAELSYKKAIDLKPALIEAHGNLGNTLKEQGKLKEAEACYKKAIELKPDLAEAFNNLGVILKELGRLEEAEACYKKAIELKPDLAEAFNNLGVILKELGRLEEAEACYKKAIELKPDDAEALYNFGNILKDTDKFQEAVVCYKQAIELNPKDHEFYNNLGIALKELREFQEAEVCYKKAIELKPDHAEAYSNLGVILKELREFQEAEVCYKKAIELKPDYAEAHCNLGKTYKEQGKLKEAEVSYKKALKINPDDAEANRYLANIKKFLSKDEHYLKMHQLYLNKNTSNEDLCHLNFGLAKACEDLQDFKQAYIHYNEGNDLRKKLLNYHISQDLELFKKIISNHKHISENSIEGFDLENSKTPIFIVGMPRSGTTLTEQIISSHSKVTGAGELNFVGQFGRNLAVGLSEISNTALLDFRELYLREIQNIAKGNLMVTDKMPQNFRYIGLIATAFPEAKIIHVKRNPSAVCWANYKQYFVSKDIGYCYSLEDVISYHKLYENLMDFWKSSFNKKIYNLDYELLVDNQESETRNLISYLGLEWDEKCLSPQDNKRNIETASSIQVRQKVYRGSSQKWKKYEQFLNGAFDELLSL